MRFFAYFGLVALCLNIEGRVWGEVDAASKVLTVESHSADGNRVDQIKLPKLLVTPRWERDVYLTDLNGDVIRQWRSKFLPASGARMLEDGGILRLGQMRRPSTFSGSDLEGGRIEIIDQNGMVKWDFWDAVTEHMSCFDALMLPNGDVLTVVGEWRSRELCEKAGRDTSKLPDGGMIFPGLIQFRPKGKSAGLPVWRWSLWNHLFQQVHPALENYAFPQAPVDRIDINSRTSFSAPNFLQIRGIDYHVQANKVLAIAQPSSQLWVINHQLDESDSNEVEPFKSFRLIDKESGQGVQVFAAKWLHPDRPSDHTIAVLGSAGSNSQACVYQVSLDHGGETLTVSPLTEVSVANAHPFLPSKPSVGDFDQSEEGFYCLATASLAGTSNLQMLRSGESQGLGFNYSLRSLTRSRDFFRYPGVLGKDGGGCCGNGTDADTQSQRVVLQGPPQVAPANSLIAIRLILPANAREHSQEF